MDGILYKNILVAAKPLLFYVFCGNYKRWCSGKTQDGWFYFWMKGKDGLKNKISIWKYKNIELNFK